MIAGTKDDIIDRVAKIVFSLLFIAAIVTVTVNAINERAQAQEQAPFDLDAMADIYPDFADDLGGQIRVSFNPAVQAQCRAWSQARPQTQTELPALCASIGEILELFSLGLDNGGISRSVTIESLQDYHGINSIEQAKTRLGELAGP